MVRRKPARIPATHALTRPELVNPGQNVKTSDTFAKTSDSTTERLGKMAEQEATALTALAVNPDMSFGELAETLGVSERTARRVKERLNSKAPTTGGKMAA